MDPFQFFPRENVRVVERDREFERIRDGWSPNRRELRELVGRLRDRFGRRRLFRVNDVIHELRLMEVEVAPRTVLREAPATPVYAVARPVDRSRVRVEIDLTADEVLS